MKCKATLGIAVIVGAFALFSYVQMEKKESMTTGTSVEAVIDPAIHVDIEMSSKSIKPFNDDTEMMDAYYKCRQDNLDLRGCINELGDTHAVSGFVLTDNDENKTVLGEYLTVDVKNETTSINYADGGLLLGSYEDMSTLAAKGELPKDMVELISHRVELIWPAMIDKTVGIENDTTKAVETMDIDVKATKKIDVDAKVEKEAPASAE